jgi:hypothetical protein
MHIPAFFRRPLQEVTGDSGARRNLGVAYAEDGGRGHDSEGREGVDSENHDWELVAAAMVLREEKAMTARTMTA